MSLDREIIGKARKCFDILFPANTVRRHFARSIYRALRGTGSAVEEASPGEYKPKIYIPKHLPLNFTKEAEPEVSIVISACNPWKHTLSCLGAILEYSKAVSYEIILIDDNPTDVTANIEKSVKNITVIKKAENPGFLENCNNAAKVARGRHILFLSNTVNPRENWLAPLISLIESNDNIGMVGSKLIHSDGSVLEAGGIIWQDVSTYQYGKGEPPGKPEYNYVKEVDYISRDSIMIKKQLWQEIGGFDPEYTHGFYAEIDLAFELRKRGYKVVFQPQSEVVDFNDNCCVENSNSESKEQQEKDRNRFISKWQETLSSENCRDENDMFKARDRSSRKKTLLLIDYIIPLYDQFAGSRTIFQYLKMFKDMNLNVKFLGQDPRPLQPYTNEVLQYGIEVLYGDYSADKFEEWLRENGKYIDYTYLHKPEPASKFIDLIKKHTNSKIIYNVADLHWVRLERQYELDNKHETLESSVLHKKMEFEIFEKSDVILTYSDYEKNILDKEFPGKKTVIEPLFIYDDKFPLGISKPESERKYITFVGGFAHKPNSDGIIWFINKIWPLIIKEVPEAKIIIIGSNPPNEILKLNSDTIEAAGFVSDHQLEEYYAKTKVIVAPLRFGAGVKGKVIEAVAHGIPVVTTEVGAEGFLERDQVLYVRDDEKAFASDVITLIKDDELWKEKHAACIEYANKYFSTKGAREIMENSVLN